jgi:cysteine desulfurase/selenocysteine lyase
MYAASLGVMVIKKEFLKSLDINFIGGGMVTSVSKDSYLMWPDDMSSWLEPGLQAYAEIISLNTAIKWLKSVNSGEYMGELSNMLFNGLSNISDVVMINKQSSPVISFYVKNIDSHRLATFLSTSNIMVRSGYFCCHYYLIEKLHLPPLLRFSIGLQNNEKDIETTIEIMKKFTKG